MQKYIAIDLINGSLKRPTPKEMLCFFIVNKINDKGFIKETALEFLDQTKSFYFYGQYEPLWHLVFDEADILVHPYADDESIAMTCGYDNFDDFAEEIFIALHSRYFIPTDVYIFYDDATVYENLKKRISMLEKNSERNRKYEKNRLDF